MAYRHSIQKKAKGGGISGIHGGGAGHDGTAPRKDPVKLAYTGQGSNVEKESREMKRGGKVFGKKGKMRLDKKARGGSVRGAPGSTKIHAAPSHKPHTPGVKASGQDMSQSPFSAAHVIPHHSDGGNPHPHHLRHKGPHKAKPVDSTDGYKRGGKVKSDHDADDKYKHGGKVHGSHSHHDGHHHSAVHIHHHRRGGSAGK